MKQSEKVVKGKISSGCDHIAIFTNNAKKLEFFYREKMGFKKEKEELLPKSLMQRIFGIASDCMFIRLFSDTVKVELFQPTAFRLKERENSLSGYNHWGYTVADRDKFCQRLKKKKANMIKFNRGNHVVYFIRDPDGNSIEIRD